MNNLPGHNKELMNHLTSFQPKPTQKKEGPMKFLPSAWRSIKEEKIGEVLCCK